MSQSPELLLGCDHCRSLLDPRQLILKLIHAVCQLYIVSLQLLIRLFQLSPLCIQLINLISRLVQLIFRYHLTHLLSQPFDLTVIVLGRSTPNHHLLVPVGLLNGVSH